MISTPIAKGRLPSDVSEARVDHHSDWSGDVYVVWRDGSGRHEARMPSDLLRVLPRPAPRASRRARHVRRRKHRG